MNNKVIRTGLIQQSNSGNIEENRKKLAGSIMKCAGMGAQLVVLQELHDSLYFCQTEDVGNFNLADEIPGEVTRHYSELAAKAGEIGRASCRERV